MHSGGVCDLSEAETLPITVLTLELNGPSAINAAFGTELANLNDETLQSS